MDSGDTIAAIASGSAPAARIIVRVSGPAAHRLAGEIAGDLPPAGGAARRRLEFADLITPGWIYCFGAPRSYTGEDGIEFHLPGAPPLARMLLDQLIRRGARLAEPGEFTARAYFNGRLDLTEAEGVAATIAAASRQELDAARQLLAGELARRLRPMMDQIAQTLALVEVGIDFSDEQVTFLPSDELRRRVEGASAALRALVSEAGRFERLTHRPRFALWARPNAGKSTLLNALAGHARAIISPIAGTTRDALSASVELRRGAVDVVDLAGIDAASAPLAPDPSPIAAQGAIESQMHASALREMEAADYLILAMDGADFRPPLDLPRPADLTVRTKADLRSNPPPPRDAGGPIHISAATGWNLPALRAEMDRLAFGADAARTTLALNARHLHAIDQAIDALTRAAAEADADAPAEVAALDLRTALNALGDVLGHLSPDDLLGRVFSSFCIGK